MLRTISQRLLLGTAAIFWLTTLVTVACANHEEPEPPPIDVAKYTVPPYVCVDRAPGTIISYSRDVAPIIAANCYDCHRSEQANGGVVLTSYNNVRPYAASVRLVGVIAHTPLYPQMPYGRPKLSDCQINTIATWVLQGYPNN